jgi:transcriptional regulator with XRE-family HTH domain
MLVREAVGDVLRRHRVEQDRTLREVSEAAAVSLGYLSEVERGKKEPSSELLASICLALRIPLAQLLGEVSRELLDAEADATPVAVGAHARVAAPAPVVPLAAPRSLPTGEPRCYAA